MEKKYKIEHNKPECISCAACVAVAEKFWEMETEDENKSHLKNSKPLETNQKWETLEIGEEDLEINKEAAEVCPVNIIHIKDKEGNKII